MPDANKEQALNQVCDRNGQYTVISKSQLFFTQRWSAPYIAFHPPLGMRFRICSMSYEGSAMLPPHQSSCQHLPDIQDFSCCHPSYQEKRREFSRQSDRKPRTWREFDLCCVDGWNDRHRLSRKWWWIGPVPFYHTNASASFVHDQPFPN